MLAQGSQTPLYAQLYAGYREQFLQCTILPASVSPWEALHGDMAKEVSLVEGKEGWMGRSFLPVCWQREDAGWIQLIGGVGMHLQALIPPRAQREPQCSLSPCSTCSC